MNKKYVLTGNNWIVTSSEIEITPLHGTRPMHPALSKKLYDKNAKKFTKPAELLYFGLPANLRYVFPYEITPFKIVPGRIPPQLKDIATTITTIDKYTIVELTHNNKHYHGLASRADCDKDNAVTGIAVAYHRAFEKMMESQK